MNTKSMDAKAKEKEKLEKMKALRRELEGEIEEKLSPEMMDQETKVEVEKVDLNQPMEPEKAKQVIEALLFAASKPLSINEIRRVARSLTPKQVEGLVLELQATYSEQGRSFEIVEIAGGYEIVTRKEFAPWILKVELQKKIKQATQSALETLAILAYKQPVTRAEIEGLRGVDVSGVVSTLMERGLIKIVGKKDVPGRPFLYGTTEKFLEHFGLGSLKDLPNIDEIQGIVETSVKKEDLLGQTKMVENTEAEQTTEETSAEAEPQQSDSEVHKDAERAISEVNDAIQKASDITAKVKQASEPQPDATENAEETQGGPEQTT